MIDEQPDCRGDRISAEMPAGSPEAVAEAFVDAINRQDLKAAIDLWSDDAVFVPAVGDAVAGKAAIRLLLAGLTSSGTKMRIDTASTHVAGEIAVRVGRLTLMHADDGGAPSELQSDYVTVYHRRATRWEIAVDAPGGFPARLPG